MIFQRKLSHRNWIAFECQSLWFECSMFTYAYSVLYVWYHLNEIESQWNHVIRSVSLCFKRNRKNVSYNLNGNRIYVAITDTALECHLCYWMLLMCMNSNIHSTQTWLKIRDLCTRTVSLHQIQGERVNAFERMQCVNLNWK